MSVKLLLIVIIVLKRNHST